MRPTRGVDPGVVVGQCGLQLGGIGAKTEGVKLKPVDIGIAGLAVYADGRRQVDANLRIGHGRLVVQPVTDNVDAEAEFVDQGIGENVGFGDAAEPAVQGNIQWEVQVVRARLPASLNAVGIGSERLKGSGVGPEEALRKAILAGAKFTIPVRGELVVAEFAGLSNEKGHSGTARCARWRIGGKRKQVTSSSRSELIALEGK